MTRLLLRFSVMLLLCCLLFVGVMIAAGKILPSGDQFLYTRRTAVGGILYGFDANRQLSVQLVDRLVIDATPVLSPDGQQVAFFRNITAIVSELFVINVDGSNLRQFTGVTTTSAIGWQPDSQHLLVDIEQEIVLLNVLNPAENIHTQLTIETFLLAVSPNGQFAAFMPAFDSGGVFCGTTIVDWQTHDDYCLAMMGQPMWSPDNSTVIFVTNEAVIRFDNWRAAGANEFNPIVLGNLNPISEQSWSPDGRWLMLMGDTRFDIFVVDLTAATPSLVNITQTQREAERNATWSPDSTRIAYISNAFGTAEIYTMNTDGSNLQRISYNNFTESTLVWLP